MNILMSPKNQLIAIHITLPTKKKGMFYYLLFDTLVLQVRSHLTNFLKVRTVLLCVKVFQGKLRSAGNDPP